MKKKAIIVLVFVIAIAGIVAVSISTSGGGRGTLVQTSQLERMELLVSKVSANGEIKPKEFVELQSEITGIITQLFVEEGDYVRKGDVLLNIDPKQLELQTTAEKALYEIAVADADNQLAQIRVQESIVDRDVAAVRKAEAERIRAKLSYEIMKSSFERKVEMFEDNLISRDTFDASKNELTTAEASLTSAELSLAQAEAQLKVTRVGLEQEKVRHKNTIKRIDQSKANLEQRRVEFAKTVIRSPLSGVITQMNVEAGERAVPGTLNNPAATLMVIADLSVIEAEVEVDETDIVRVEVGQLAEVEVDALPDQPLRGRVTEVGSSAIQRAGHNEAKDFKVVIELVEPPTSLRPGLSCTGQITTAERKDVLTIPIQALTIREFELDESGQLIREDRESRRRGRRRSSTNRDEKASKDKTLKEEIEGVFVVTDGSARFVPVETGITGETEIEVNSGLSESDTIVVGSYKALRDLEDGDRVRSEKEKS